MAQQANWVTFDSDEALSLSNNPKVDSPTNNDQFEFQFIATGDNTPTKMVDMCAAEDVFFHGYLLPLCLSFDSSASVSRSLSSNSCDALLRIKSNNLYAYPSPNPRVRSSYRNGGARRPPVKWGLFRLGVAMAPEMEVSDMRVRLARGGSERRREKSGSKVWRLLGGGGGGLMGCRSSPEDVLNGKKKSLTV